ncbi:MAG: ribonuclease H family protein [Coleofasciculus sp. G3-WIS-01]|uniref:ribonuclease H1 domain-containing protein n=1 Tax=Coleofasciculus sp. G3-WIS-01 TaxID=3069528 RepID=UPI0032F84423
MKSNKYYAVLKGRKTGLFTSWQECEKQVKGFSGAIYKSYKTIGEAEAELGVTEQLSIFKFSEKEVNWCSPSKKNIAASQLIRNSICVDASCIGNPGDVEYRGVDTATGEVVFHKRPMSNGTNNLGEFLAIVHALAYLKNKSSNIPIYSDSETAITWLKNKQVRTTLKSSPDNEEIFDLVKRALNWLEANEYKNSILKWNTGSWGEIPADFGRK